MKKRNILLSSICSIMLCLSIVVGATFALFTSESKVNVAVTSGKVEVNAYATNERLSSTLGANLPETSIRIEDNEVIIDKIVPGDVFNFDIIVENKSNVTVKYQTIISLVEGLELFNGLEVTIGDAKFNGMTATSAWNELAPVVGENATVFTVPVSITLPVDAGNEYQDLTTKLSYTIKAVQANADTEEIDESAITISNANDLRLFASSVSEANTYRGQTVVLLNDIDLAGEEWTPIDNFGGTFDGRGHVIKNVVMNGERKVAFFNYSDAQYPLTVKNLTLENVTATGTEYVAGLVAACDIGATLENCHIKGNVNITGNWMVGGLVGSFWASNMSNCTLVANTGSIVIGNYLESDIEGDSVGGLVGYSENATIASCEVANLKVTGSRKVGGVAGCVANETLSNIKVSNVEVSTNAPDGYATGKLFVGGVVGEYLGTNTLSTATISNSTVNGKLNQVGAVTGGTRVSSATFTETNVTVTNVSALAVIAEGLSYNVTKAYYEISSANGLSLAGSTYFKKGGVFHIVKDIDMTGATYATADVHTSIEIYGNNKVISNLNVTAVKGNYGEIAAGLLSINNSPLTIKDLTINGFTVANPSVAGSVGAFVAVINSEGNPATVLFENLEVKNMVVEDVTNGCYVGGIIGSGVNDGTNTVTFSNCSVDKSTLHGSGSTGGIAGHCFTGAGNVVVENCSVTNSKITADESSSVGYKAGAIIGTVNTNCVTMKNCTFSGNTVTANGETVTTAYGRNTHDRLTIIND